MKFLYTSRLDNAPIYRSDAMMKTLVTLSDIETFANGTEVLDYQLNYQLSSESGNSVLVSVNPLSGDGTAALLPLNFGWNGPTGTYASAIGVPSQVLPSPINVAAAYTPGGTGSGNSGSGIYNLGTNSQYLAGDFNGDGVTDFVQLAPGQSNVPVCFSTYGGGGFNCTSYSISTTFSSSTTFLVADFNGDGLADIAQVDATTNSMTVCYSSGDGHFSCQTKSMPGISSGRFIVLDVNGDGKADLIEYGIYGNNTLEVCLSQGSGVDNICSAVSPSGFVNYGAGEDTQILAGDFDGDGLFDFVQYSPASSSVIFCYSNGDTTFDCETQTITPLSGGTSIKAFVGDFNGDGISDFGIFVNNVHVFVPLLKNGKAGSKIVDASGLWACESVGRGNTPTCGLVVMPLELATDGAVYSPIAVADLNGDGRTDLVTPTSSGQWQVCYSGSDGSMNCTTVAASTGSSILQGDFTGNGTDSILTLSPTSTSVAFSGISSFYPDLLTTVANGLGATTTINYSPLTDSSIYTKGSGSTSPNIDFQNSAYVVSQVQEPDGIGSTRAFNFDYFGAKFNQLGRGFLGFASVVKQDVNGNLKTETDYNQTYPYIGYASTASSWIKQGSAWNLATQSTYTYANETFDTTTRAFPYLQSEIDNQYDFANSGTFVATASTQNEFDTYGNLTSVVVTTGDGYQKATTNTPTNITGGPGSIWYLGQLASSQQVNTNPDGTSVTRTSQFNYSTSFPNEVLSEQLQPGGVDYLTKTYGYDTFGNRNSVSITGSGMAARNTTIAYDSLGQFPKTITNAYSQTEIQYFDPRFGIMNKLQDQNGLITTWTIDVLGRKTNETRPDGTQTNVTFTPCFSSCNGQTYNVQVTKTGAPTTTSYFDVFDREYKKSTGGFNSSTIWQFKSYDSVGRTLSTSRNMYSSDNYNYTYYAYDNGNRIVREADPDGTSKLWSYSGLSTTVTNNNNQTRTEVKNDLGQVTQVTDAANQTTLYKYDPFGNLTTTTDPLGHKIVLTYDVLGRKIGMVDPDFGSWSYTYDGAGDVLTQKDAKNQTQTMTYDNLGRMLTRHTAEFTGTWTYDSATNGVGKLASLTNSSGFTKTYAYDSFGRTSSETTTADTSYPITTTYDSSSRISKITYPEGFAVNYAYDSNGYLKEMDNASSGAMLWQRNAQNADNLPLQETFGNGVISNSAYYSTTGRLSGVVATSGSTTLQNLAVTYDALGNTTRRTDLVNQYTGATETESYNYDNLNRLTSSSNSFVTKDFSYDGLGNIVSKTDVGDMKYGDGTVGRPLHAVTSSNGPTQFTFAYDANGNMTRGEGRTVSWTSFNKPSNISNASNSVTFSYGPDFERYKEVETTCSDYLGNSSTTCVKYMINPRQDIGIHFEKEMNGSITSYRNFLYAGAGNVVGVYTTRSDGTSATRYFHKDHLGSVVLSTYDNGTVAERLSYDAFGKRRNNIGTDDPNDLLKSIVSHQGFTGQEQLDDGGIGLIDMNGRMYDPLIGRFMSPDPMIQAPRNLQSLNRYSYVINNPTSLIDPSGYWWGNDVVNWVSGAASTVGNAVSSAASWVGNNAVTIVAVAAVIGVSVVTFGAADVALAPALGGFGAALVAGAASGAIAGALSSTLLGGGFSWKAVGLGALAGAVGGGIGSITSGLGNSVGAIAARVGTSALAGGASSWLVSVVQGDPSWRAFYQGAAVGGLVSMATIGLEYLSESSATDSTEDSIGSSTSDQNSGSSQVGRNPASVTDEQLGNLTVSGNTRFPPIPDLGIEACEVEGIVCGGILPFFMPGIPHGDTGCLGADFTCGTVGQL